MSKSKVTESEVRSQVKDYLKYHGWFVFHVMQGMGSYKGVSDLIACKKGVVLFIELKTEAGVQSKYQVQFESDIIEKDCHYFVARCWKDVSEYIDQEV